MMDSASIDLPQPELADDADDLAAADGEGDAVDRLDQPARRSGCRR